MNEEIITEQTEQGLDTSNMYLEQIKNLKATTVSKEEYDKILNENRNLLQTIVEGNSQQSTSVDNKPQVNLNDLRKDLFQGHNNNIEYVTKALALRQGIIDQGGIDPFLPIGHNIVPSEEDIASANRVAKVFSECVEYAQGDNESFTNELQRRTIDSGFIRRNK